MSYYRGDTEQQCRQWPQRIHKAFQVQMRFSCLRACFATRIRNPSMVQQTARHAVTMSSVDGWLGGETS